MPDFDVLTRKLQGFAELSDAERGVIQDLCSRTRDCQAGENLIEEGERPNKVFLLLEGWAYRYKHLPSGKRQIMAYLIPGDLCDIHIFILRTMDHGIALLSRAKVAEIAPDKLLEAMDRHPRLERALWWATLVDEAVLREWLVNIGRRDAYERVAHLLYEMWLRMRAIGLAEPRAPFSLPLTQPQLGDTMGLTPVAVNKALQRLRGEGLITLSRRELTIHDPERLAAISRFEPNYLHLDVSAPASKNNLV